LQQCLKFNKIKAFGVLKIAQDHEKRTLKKKDLPS